MLLGKRKAAARGGTGEEQGSRRTCIAPPLCRRSLTIGCSMNSCSGMTRLLLYPSSGARLAGSTLASSSVAGASLDDTFLARSAPTCVSEAPLGALAAIRPALLLRHRCVLTEMPAGHDTATTTLAYGHLAVATRPVKAGFQASCSPDPACPAP